MSAKLSIVLWIYFLEFTSGLKNDRFEELDIETSSARSCVLKCDSMRSDQLKKAITGLTIRQLFPFDAFLFLTMNDGLIGFYCSIQEEYTDCVDRCPESKFKRIAKNVDTFNEIACSNIGQNVKHHFTCMKSMSPSTYCLEGCSPHHLYSYELMNNFFRWIMDDNQLQIQSRVAIACRYMLCAFECELNSIRRQCGEPTHHFMHQVLVFAFARSLRKSLEEADMQWPAICDIFEHRIHVDLLVEKLKHKVRLHNRHF